jgi:hypothetical protein
LCVITIQAMTETLIPETPGQELQRELMGELTAADLLLKFLIYTDFWLV